MTLPWRRGQPVTTTASVRRAVALTVAGSAVAVGGGGSGGVTACRAVAGKCDGAVRV